MDNLLEYLNHKNKKTFNELLFSYIDKKGEKDSTIYKKVDIDRKLFSKIRCSSNYIPRKKVIIKLCIALELDSQDFQILLNSAGYALSEGNNFDLIISYCMEKKIYDMDKINNYLYRICNTVL